MNIKWPAIYLQESKDGELMYISSDDWNFDVDSHYAIGPLRGETDHFLVDSDENVFRLINPYVSKSGDPHFEFEKVEKPALIDLVKARAMDQLNNLPEDFSSLVKELDYK